MVQHSKAVIYVRGRKREYDAEKISFRQVVDFAYPDGQHRPAYEYDVTWKDGPKDEAEGVLKEGDYVSVVDGMRFDVKFTDKS